MKHVSPWLYSSRTNHLSFLVPYRSLLRSLIRLWVSTPGVPSVKEFFLLLDNLPSTVLFQNPSIKPDNTPLPYYLLVASSRSSVISPSLPSSTSNAWRTLLISSLCRPELTSSILNILNDYLTYQEFPVRMKSKELTADNSHCRMDSKDLRRRGS